MKTKLYNEFTGLNVQRLAALSDQKTSPVAKNVYLTSAKKWRTRPGSKRRFTFPASTKGLYSAGGVLRCIAPAGDAAVFNAQRPNLFFDFIDAAGGAPTEFISAQPLGASAAAGGKVYAAIKRGGKVEHHWFQTRPQTPGGDVDNKVDLPFAPSGNIIGVGEKLWTLDNPRGVVPFSSTQFGPTNWTAEDDAGFLPALANAPGAREMTALGTLQSAPGAANRRQAALVVYFADGVQIWAVDPVPINHYLTTILDGPGTENPRSVVNALGHPVFLSRNGFRSLRLAFNVGAMDTLTIGHPIEPLTEGLGPDSVTAALWWDKIGAYLAAVGSTIYCWRYDPLTKTQGWSVWEMPWSITDLIDHEGALYARTTDNAGYEISDAFTTDDGADIPFALETQFLHADSPQVIKGFDSVKVFQEGDCTLSMRPDSSFADVLTPIYDISGVTHRTAQVPLFAESESIALRFEGVGQWQLDGFVLAYQPYGV